MADYWGEARPVRARFAKRLSQALAVRLDQETLEKLREEARARGIGPTTLVRMWVLERLQAIARHKAAG
ncbi:MAG: hypothetical protein HY331_14325 [Chloroflexi bacterium]|nr:hypothetical protein [Chloroflexota bacterium]